MDTEEEFDWEADFDPKSTSVRAMRHLHRAQRVFEEFDLRPTYVVDYPVASQEEGYAPIKELVDRGRAELGAHLHPWVSPPHDEEVNRVHSFAGNLAPELEAAKLRRLAAKIEESFGRRPRIYKAGRYGFGPNTATALGELGFEADLSFCPAFDFSGEGGPDYSHLTGDPYWFGPGRSLLGLPASGAFVGLLYRQGPWLHRWASRPTLCWARVVGILSRLRLNDRLHLSPEGYDFGELRRLTNALLRRGQRVFTLSLHSPTLSPGCTPYTQSETDVERFLDGLRRYLGYFLGSLAGTARTPLELKQILAQRESSSQ